MSDVTGLLERIDAELAAWKSRQKNQETAQLERHHEREERAKQFERLLDDLQDVWRPRLDALAARFGERVQVTPTVTPGRRNAVFQFQSPVARVTLKFTATPNLDVTEVVLGYDLDILPILMQYEKHAELKFPLNAVDRTAVGSWLDDRIVQFVQTYLALHENQYYLKDHMVEDPVVHVQFPKFAAGATLERDGKTMYFLSEETCQQFQEQKTS